MNRLGSFSQNANPLITQLHPSARLLSANLKQMAKVAPSFNSFFIGFRKLAKRSVTGLPSLRTLLDTDLPPLLTEVTPFSRQITPIVAGVGRYQSDVTGFLGNIASALNATGTTETGQNIHYIRSSAPLFPDSLGDVPLAPALLLSGEPVPGPQQRAQGCQRARHLRHPGVLGPTGLVASLNPLDSVYTGNPFFSNRATFDTPQELLDDHQEVRRSPARARATAGASRRPRAPSRRRSPRSGRSASRPTTRTSTRIPEPFQRAPSGRYRFFG